MAVSVEENFYANSQGPTQHVLRSGHLGYLLILSEVTSESCDRGQSVFDNGRRQTHRLTPLNFVDLKEFSLLPKLSELCVSQERVCVTIVEICVIKVVICVIKNCDLCDHKL